MSEGVLSGMKVVEGSAFVAAPLGGMTLAQLGADVIRFDPIGGGLDYRRWPIADNGMSLFWAGMNKGKRSFQVDIGHAEGRELIMELLRGNSQEDGIFLTNFPERGWLAYEKLKEVREDLIYVNIMGDRRGGSALDYTVNCGCWICEAPPVIHRMKTPPTTSCLPGTILRGRCLRWHFWRQTVTGALMVRDNL